MVVQALLAALLAVPFFFRTQVSRFVGMLRSRFDRKAEYEDSVRRD